MKRGHVNPSKIKDPGLIYDIESDYHISYLCSFGYTDKKVSAVVHCQVECLSIDALSAEELNYPYISVSMGSHSEKIVTRMVMNVGEEDGVYCVQIKASEGVEVVSVYPERLEYQKDS